MQTLFYESGYELVTGTGKGSHWKLKKNGCPTVITPNDAELAKDTKHVLLPSWCRYLRIRSFEGLQKSDDGADFNDLKDWQRPSTLSNLN